jgi:hypothetical protein
VPGPASQAQPNRGTRTLVLGGVPSGDSSAPRRLAAVGGGWRRLAAVGGDGGDGGGRRRGARNSPVRALSAPARSRECTNRQLSPETDHSPHGACRVCTNRQQQRSPGDSSAPPGNSSAPPGNSSAPPAPAVALRRARAAPPRLLPRRRPPPPAATRRRTPSHPAARPQLWRRAARSSTFDQRVMTAQHGCCQIAGRTSIRCP